MRASAISATALSVLLLGLPGRAAAAPQFTTSDTCIACHNGLTSPAGRDISFGYSWRPSMMANAARDPYWQAAVRRETLDHPRASAAIQDECSRCHMPMANYSSRAAGGKGRVFAHLGGASTPRALLAQDGVSCSACHQISPKNLGHRESFTGGFIIDDVRAKGQPRSFGPYAITGGLDSVMRSAAEFQPEKSLHVQQSEICASCHTLFTHALGPDGKQLGTLPEQVPYLEWKHSDYRDARSCQSCHMPVVRDSVPIASVLGEPREGFSRHVFRGGNFFMPRVLNRYRAEQNVRALPLELEAGSRQTTDHLQTAAARLRIIGVRAVAGVLEAEIEVTNLAGHKLPTAYPSRRAWLHVTVTDGGGRVLLESGAVSRDGSIQGNDNDRDGGRFEPHHTLIDGPDKVQIYEVIMADHEGRVTTGLLRATRFIKDNRVLPDGFDKASASSDVAVRGGASTDGDFTSGQDRVRYRAPLGESKGPMRIEAALTYQPIGYRWAINLADYKATEPARFVAYYRAMSSSSWVVLARTSATWEPPPPTSAPAAP